MPMKATIRTLLLEFRVLLSCISIALAVGATALASSVSPGKSNAYLPELVKETTSKRGYLREPLAVCENSDELFQFLRQANRHWLDRSAQWPDTQLEYETVFMWKNKPNTEERRKVAGGYDRGIDYWVPSDLLLYHSGKPDVYEGVESDTCVLYLEIVGREIPQRHREFGLCKYPFKDPPAWYDMERLLRASALDFREFSLESVFSKETGCLLKERFVPKLTNGAFVAGWETAFNYANGNYPSTVVMRSLPSIEHERKQGYSVRTMEFGMFDSVWMLQRADHLSIEPFEDPEEHTGWLIENRDIKVTRFK